MGGSVTAAVRQGRWQDPAVTPLGVVAVGAAVLDFATTAHIITDPAYYEGNEFYAGLAEVDPWLAAGVMGAKLALLLALAWLRLGWLSDVAGAYLVVVAGVSGLNNVVLFLTGTAPFESASLSISTITQLVLPVAGIGLGLALARYRGRVPLREVAVVLAVALSAVFVSHAV